MQDYFLFKGSNILSVGVDVFNQLEEYSINNIHRLTIIEESVTKLNLFSPQCSVMKIRAYSGYILEVSRLFDYIFFSIGDILKEPRIFTHSLDISKIGLAISNCDLEDKDYLARLCPEGYIIKYHANDKFCFIFASKKSRSYLLPSFQNKKIFCFSNFLDMVDYSRKLDAEAKLFLNFIFNPLSLEGKHLALQSSIGFSSRDYELLIRDVSCVDNMPTLNVPKNIQSWHSLKSYSSNFFLKLKDQKKSKFLLAYYELCASKENGKVKFINILSQLLLYPPESYDFIKFWSGILLNEKVFKSYLDNVSLKDEKHILDEYSAKTLLTVATNITYRQLFSEYLNEIAGALSNKVINSIYLSGGLKELVKPEQVDSALIEYINSMQINDVVIWGYKMPSHTHHFIHLAFYYNFKSLGVNVIWVDDESYMTEWNCDKASVLYITMDASPSICDNMPIREDCYYFIHRTSRYHKYKHLNKSNILFFNELRYDAKVLVNTSITTPYLNEIRNDLSEISNSPFDKLLEVEYLSVSSQDYYLKNSKICFISWGADLGADQIIENINNLPKLVDIQLRSKRISWVGSIWRGPWGGNYSAIIELIKICNQYGYEFYQLGKLIHEDFFSLLPYEWPVNFNYSSPSFTENKEVCSHARLAPAFQGEDQLGRSIVRNDPYFFYIPDRLFKNISYGCLGISNNPYIDSKVIPEIINDIDVCVAFERAMDLSFYKKQYIDIIENQMIHVAQHHTFKHKLLFMFKCLNQ